LCWDLGYWKVACFSYAAHVIDLIKSNINVHHRYSSLNHQTSFSFGLGCRLDPHTSWREFCSRSFRVCLARLFWS
jgi:hypothetical protein